MAKTKNDNTAYKELMADIRSGQLRRVYVLYGEEGYLLRYCLDAVRRTVPAGTEDFNIRRIDGKSFSIGALSESVDTVPMFSPVTVTEIWDYDIGGANEETRSALVKLLSDVPEYAVVLFVYDTVPYKLDGRLRTNAALRKLFTEVELVRQEQNELVSWIARHFRAGGKKIEKDTAAYLAFITGGLMTNLDTEIEKLISYCQGDTVTTEDIDKLVTPELNAAIFQLTDAVIKKDYDPALRKMWELQTLNEPGGRILAGISSVMRQMLAAKILADAGRGYMDLKRIYRIPHDFQAKNIFSAARKMSTESCARAVRLCNEAVYLQRTGSADESWILPWLLLELAFEHEEAAG